MDINYQQSQLGYRPSEGGNTLEVNQSDPTFVPLRISPSGSVFIEHDSDPRHSPNLSTSNNSNISPPTSTLVPGIVSTLKSYRRQMDKCIRDDYCYTEVAHADFLVAECALRLETICERIGEDCMRPLTQLSKEYRKFEIDMRNGSLNMSTRDGFAK